MRGLLKASTLLLAPALASALIKDPVGKFESKSEPHVAWD